MPRMPLALLFISALPLLGSGAHSQTAPLPTLQEVNTLREDAMRSISGRCFETDSLCEDQFAQVALSAAHIMVKMGAIDLSCVEEERRIKIKDACPELTRCVVLPPIPALTRMPVPEEHATTYRQARQQYLVLKLKEGRKAR